MNNIALILFFIYTVLEYYLVFEFKSKKGELKGLSLTVDIFSSFLVSTIIILLFFSKPLLFSIGIFLLFHTLSRIGRFIYTKILNKEITRLIFILRQVVMMIVVILISWLFYKASPNGVQLAINDNGLPVWKIIKFILAIFMITKPVNEIFKKIFPNLKPPDIGRQKESIYTRKIGGIIGNMERLLIFIFLLTGDYLGIGFVFTAKSITRYKRISMQREFAEYYLLGTLYSILAALVVYGFVFIIL